MISYEYDQLPQMNLGPLEADFVIIMFLYKIFQNNHEEIFEHWGLQTGASPSGYTWMMPCKSALINPMQSLHNDGGCYPPYHYSAHVDIISLILSYAHPVCTVFINIILSQYLILSWPKYIDQINILYRL